MKDLILSAHHPELRERHDKKFLFDIVANGINGIDVDKCAPHTPYNGGRLRAKCLSAAGSPTGSRHRDARAFAHLHRCNALCKM